MKDHLLKLLREVKEKLLAQGMKSREGDDCVYQNACGYRCAVGLLMNDEEVKVLHDFSGSVGMLCDGYPADGELRMHGDKYKETAKSFLKRIGVNSDVLLEGTPRSIQYRDPVVNLLSSLQKLHDDAEIKWWEPVFNKAEEILIDPDETKNPLVRIELLCSNPTEIISEL